MAPEYASVFNELKDKFHDQFPNESVEFLVGYVRGGEPVKTYSKGPSGRYDQERIRVPEPRTYFGIQAGDHGYGEYMYNCQFPSAPELFADFERWLETRDG